MGSEVVDLNRVAQGRPLNKWKLEFSKMWEITLLGKQLLSSQGSLYFMELDVGLRVIIFKKILKKFNLWFRTRLG
jgi:hypothetical protein